MPTTTQRHQSAATLSVCAVLALAGCDDSDGSGGNGAGQSGAEKANNLNAGMFDELLIHLVPVLLGGGERLFAGVDPAQVGSLELAEAIPSDGVTHLRLRPA